MSGNIFKWRKRRQLSSDMDSRFGDISISAPNEGSWNEIAHTPAFHSPSSEMPKGSRLKALFRSNAAEQPVYMHALEQPAAAVRSERPEIPVPHHPMVDIEAHKRSLSADGRRASGSRRTGSGQTLVNTGSPRNIVDVLDSSSSCSCDGDDEDEDERKTRRPSQRSLSQDSTQPRSSRNRQHRSPPLSSTAVMRRYSSQSTAHSSLANSTPSTATFSSRHTSMTSSSYSHGHYQPSMTPRRLEGIPPVPQVAPSFSSSRWGKKSRATSSRKRPTGPSIGPQELVPSQDELWGY